MKTSVKLFIALMFVLLGIVYYDMKTTTSGEFQSITEKIPAEVGENCTLYKTYQVCEEGKRCEGEKPMKWPVYTTVCNDGHTKTEEHIVRIQ